MTITAHYTDADHTTIARSDRPGLSIPAVDGNAQYQELMRLGLTISDYVAPSPNVEDVKAEAERRIAVGCLINGVQFRCDDASTGRLDGMAQRFKREEAAGGSYEAKFRTASGVTITVTTAEQAFAILDAAIDYVNLILGKSAELQAMGSIPANFTDDSYWT